MYRGVTNTIFFTSMIHPMITHDNIIHFINGFIHVPVNDTVDPLTTINYLPVSYSNSMDGLCHCENEMHATKE